MELRMARLGTSTGSVDRDMTVCRGTARIRVISGTMEENMIYQSKEVATRKSYVRYQDAGIEWSDEYQRPP
jgi:hypothetical protein